MRLDALLDNELFDWDIGNVADGRDLITTNAIQGVTADKDEIAVSLSLQTKLPWIIGEFPFLWYSISLCRATSTQDQVSLPLGTISTMPVLRRPFRDSVHLTPGTLELLLVLRYGTKRVKVVVYSL
ncbi:unnamed protein product [Aspergillus oryzae RIB40]|uniref:DNA, SC003 n=2 Tax=Aspergillus oryzae TaxID=5062 RepID=Q2UKE7_ASPOR|nr:unnamed protein product [Aspergillus oryzae RIB40]EIT83213.1 hypothetical protein Ao3042_11526 [Aspergillus oryzae 3.042]KDE80187.1 hypothetical protein AO1008_06886 [Aspergillus oryzae 100-8]BAE57968.1 unnamed protein product [Aspergillus oryzae RIB40]|eukprot:EIT83213.1 hypothetical protein Ao3042_11526 [Aspergillus oryzae 3.042]